MHPLPPPGTVPSHRCDESVHDHGADGIETSHVQHVWVVRVGQREAIAREGAHDQLGPDARLMSVLSQCVCRRDAANLCFRVRVHDKHVKLFVLSHCPQDRRGAVSVTFGDTADGTDNFWKRHAGGNIYRH